MIRAYLVLRDWPEPASLNVLRSALEALGFSVKRVSPASITIEAEPGIFEQVFRMRVERHDLPGGVPAHYWTSSAQPRIPEELKNEVESVVFPLPARLTTA
jgi:hypothetical protein